MPRRPELLSPAGNWDCARAAVANGADAIYFGLDCGFNARARAANFDVADLSDLMAFLHRHQVKGYVTLNTLAFSAELAALEDLIRRIALARADAVLVQDLGLAKLVRAIAPDLSIHASTQMTMTSAEGIEQIVALGIERVVLARELSVDEIAEIHNGTKMPLETFVHGALCVAYSGQCLTSESLGGRSANRGQCAQACRLPYELVCDGQNVDLGEQRYLLSPQDLAAYALIPDLIAAGVVSLKIEGRLKTPEYVANITRHYRQAIDAAVAGQPVEFKPREVEEMELSFSRGFSVGWLGGNDHKMLVPALSSSKRGVLTGEVVEVRERGVRVRLRGRIKAGDGIVFDGDRSEGNEQGGRVFAIFQRGRRIEGDIDRGIVDVTFLQDAVDLDQLHEGQRFWKTDDPELTRRLRKSFDGDIPLPDLPVDFHVQAIAGDRLFVTATCPHWPAVTVQSDEPLPIAQKHPLTEDVLREQFSRLGGTGFVHASLSATIMGNPMVPLSVLGKLRKALVERLQEQRRTEALPEVHFNAMPALDQLRPTFDDGRHGSGEPHLSVLCRNLPQMRALLGNGVNLFYADFQDIREYREATALASEAGVLLYLATPRIQKPGEMGIFTAMARHAPDGVLVRNLSGLSFFAQQQISCIADFSLNAANELTVAHLLGQGAIRVTASYDLNRDQLVELVRHSPSNVLEVVIHQHIPMFHMEHCVFCAVLSPGTNKTNCGRPCDVHQVQLRDRVGIEHPLKADVGCRNTLFNAVPQSGAEVVNRLLELGVRHFRIELLDDNEDQSRRIVDLYRRLLAGEVDGGTVWHELKASNRIGVTRGTLEERRNPLTIL